MKRKSTSLSQPSLKSSKFPKLAKSIRKHIRKEKARIRREVLDLKEQEKQIEELYKKTKKKKIISPPIPTLVLGEKVGEGEESKLSSSPFVKTREGEEDKSSSSPFASAREGEESKLSSSPFVKTREKKKNENQRDLQFSD